MKIHSDSQSSGMIPQYLDRIGYSGKLDPSSGTLRALHAHHMFAVPFENLDIHLGRPITCDVGQFFEKIVTRRRGGFCYELNGLFAELLRGIGFEVELLSGRVRTEASTFGPEFDHMALLVHADSERWLADVGFGESFVAPLRLDTEQVQLDPGGEFRMAREGEGCILFHDGTPEYRFTLTPRSLEEFGPMCHYQQTSPDSVFTKKRVCSRATPDGRITITDSKLIVTSNGSRTESDLRDEAAWRTALREHFEIVL